MQYFARRLTSHTVEEYGQSLAEILQHAEPPGKTVDLAIHVLSDEFQCYANGELIEPLFSPDENSAGESYFKTNPLNWIWYESGGPARISNVSIIPGA